MTGQSSVVQFPKAPMSISERYAAKIGEAAERARFSEGACLVHDAQVSAERARSLLDTAVALDPTSRAANARDAAVSIRVAMAELSAVLDQIEDPK